MLFNEVRVLLAGVDMSYTNVNINPMGANITIQYTDYWDSAAKRFRDDMKNIIKYEPIPVMILAKMPQDTDTHITFNNAIIIFEGLVQEIVHRKEPKMNLNMLSLSAVKLSHAVLSNIQYNTINIPLAFQNFGGVVDVAAQAVKQATTGEAKVEYSPASQGAFSNTSLTFIKKLVLGNATAQASFNPDDLYVNFLDNLLIPMGMDPNALQRLSTNYYLSECLICDGNIFMPLVTFSSWKAKVGEKSNSFAVSTQPRLAQHTVDTFKMYPLPKDVTSASELEKILKKMREDVGLVASGSTELLSFLDYVIGLVGHSTYTDLPAADTLDALISNSWGNVSKKIQESKNKAARIEDNTGVGDLGVTNMETADLVKLNQSLQESTTQAVALFFSAERAIIQNIMWHVLAALAVNKVVVADTKSKTNTPQSTRINVLSLLTSNAISDTSQAVSVSDVETAHIKTVIVALAEKIKDLWDWFHETLFIRISETPTVVSCALYREFSKYFIPSPKYRSAYTNIFHGIMTVTNYLMPARLEDENLLGADYGCATNALILRKSADTLTIDNILKDAPARQIVAGVDTAEYITNNMLDSRPFFAEVFAYVYDLDSSNKTSSAVVGGSFDVAGKTNKVDISVEKIWGSGPSVLLDYKYALRDDILQGGGSVEGEVITGIDSSMVVNKLSLFMMAITFKMAQQCEQAASSFMKGVQPLFIASGYKATIMPMDLYSENDITKSGVKPIDDMLQGFYANYRGVLVGSTGKPDFSKLKLWDILTARHLSNYNLRHRFNTFPSLAGMNYDRYFPTFQLSNFAELQQCINQVVGSPQNSFTAYQALGSIYNHIMYSMNTSMNMPVYDYKNSPAHAEIFLAPANTNFIPPKCNILVADKRYEKILNKVTNATTYQINQSSMLEEMDPNKTGSTIRTYMYDIMSPDTIYTLEDYENTFGGIMKDGTFNVSYRQYYELDKIMPLDVGPYVDFLNNIRKQYRNETEIVNGTTMSYGSTTNSNKLPNVMNVDKMFMRNTTDPSPQDTYVKFGILNIAQPWSGKTGIDTLDKISNENWNIKQKNKKAEEDYKLHPKTETATTAGPDGAVQTAVVVPFKKPNKEKVLLGLADIYSKSELVAEPTIPTAVSVISKDTPGYHIIGVFGSNSIVSSGSIFSIRGSKSEEDMEFKDQDYVGAFFSKADGKRWETSVSLGLYYNLNETYDDPSDPVNIGSSIRMAMASLMDIVNRSIIAHLMFGATTYLKSVDKKEKDDNRVVFLRSVSDIFAESNMTNLLDHFKIKYKTVGNDVEITFELDEAFLNLYGNDARVKENKTNLLDMLKSYTNEYLNKTKLVLGNFIPMMETLARGLVISKPGTDSAKSASFIADDANHIQISNADNSSTIAGRADGNMDGEPVHFRNRFNNAALNTLAIVNEGGTGITFKPYSILESIIDDKKMGSRDFSYYTQHATPFVEYFGYDATNKTELLAYPNYQNAVTNITALSTGPTFGKIGKLDASQKTGSGRDKSLDTNSLVIIASGGANSSDVVKAAIKETPNLLLSTNHINNVHGETNKSRYTYVLNCLHKVWVNILKTNPAEVFDPGKISEEVRTTIPYIAGNAAYQYYTKILPPVLFSTGTEKITWTGDFLSPRSYSIHGGVDYATVKENQPKAIDPGIPLFAPTNGYIIYRIQKDGRKDGFGFHGLFFPEYKDNMAGKESLMFMYCHMQPKKMIEFLSEVERNDKTKIYRQGEKIVLYPKRDEINEYLTVASTPEKAKEDATKKRAQLIEDAHKELEQCIYKVNAGDVVGFMGNSGMCITSVEGSNGTHLHFEVRKVKYPKDLKSWKSIEAAYCESQARVAAAKAGYNEAMDLIEAYAKNAGSAGDKLVRAFENKTKATANLTEANRIIEDCKIALLKVLVHPHEVGLNGIPGITQCTSDQLQSLADRLAGAGKFKPVAVSSADLASQVATAKSDVGSNANTKVPMEDCIESLKYYIWETVLNNMYTEPVEGVQLNYYDPYFVDGNFSFAVLYDNDIMFTRLQETALNKTTTDLGMSLRFSGGFSLRYMLYFYLHFMRIKTINSGKGSKEIYNIFKECLTKYPMFPFSLIEEYNKTILNRDSMNVDYSKMFGRDDFAFWWPKYVRVKYIKGANTYYVNLGRVITGDVKVPGATITSTEVIDYLLAPANMFNLINLNDDFLTVDYDSLYAEETTKGAPQGMSESVVSTGVVSGETKMLFNIRKWAPDKLYNLSKWKIGNFRYLQTNLNDQMLTDGRYMDVYTPTSVMQGVADFSDALMNMSQKIGGGNIYGKPLLYQDWNEVFKTIRSKSFKV